MSVSQRGLRSWWDSGRGERGDGGGIQPHAAIKWQPKTRLDCVYAKAGADFRSAPRRFSSLVPGHDAPLPLGLGVKPPARLEPAMPGQKALGTRCSATCDSKGSSTPLDPIAILWSCRSQRRKRDQFPPPPPPLLVVLTCTRTLGVAFSTALESGHFCFRVSPF